MENTVKTQEELDSYLFNYEPNPDDTQVLYIVSDGGALTFDSKEKNVADLIVWITNGTDSNNKIADLNITFVSPPQRIDVYRSRTNLTCNFPKNELSGIVKVSHVNKCQITALNVQTIDIVQSYIYFNSHTSGDRFDINKHSTICITDSSVLVGHSDSLQDANVTLRGHTIMSNHGQIDRVNFYLYDSSRLNMHTDNYYRCSYCAFDSSSIDLMSSLDSLRGEKEFYDNAHISYSNKYYDSILDYCEKRNIEHTNTYGYFYKIVRKENDRLVPVAYIVDDFEYYVGDYAYPNNGFSEDSSQCESGIHCGDLNYILRNFGNLNGDLVVLKLRVEFKDFAPYKVGRVPEKLRCKKVFVEKIVDPNNLGLRSYLLQG